MDHPDLIAFNFKKNSIGLKWINIISLRMTKSQFWQYSGWKRAKAIITNAK